MLGAVKILEAQFDVLLKDKERVNPQLSELLSSIYLVRVTLAAGSEAASLSQLQIMRESVNTCLKDQIAGVAEVLRAAELEPVLAQLQGPFQWVQKKNAEVDSPAVAAPASVV